MLMQSHLGQDCTASCSGRPWGPASQQYCFPPRRHLRTPQEFAQHKSCAAQHRCKTAEACQEAANMPHSCPRTGKGASLHHIYQVDFFLRHLMSLQELNISIAKA